MNFQQWYLRQAFASNLLNSFTNSTQSNSPPLSVDDPPKVIRPTASRSFKEWNDGLDSLTRLNQAIVNRKKSGENKEYLKKTFDETIQSSNSAFKNYAKSKQAKSFSMKLTENLSKVNRVWNSKNSLVTHQNFRILEKVNSEFKGNIIAPLINQLKANLVSSKSNYGRVNAKEEIKCDISEDDTSRSKTSVSKSNFKLRTDVVTKTILRAFKKYYTTKFKEFYDFSKVKKSNTSDEEFLRAAGEYVTNQLSESNFDEMHIFLASIVDTKQKGASSDPKYEKLRGQVNSLLYSFNKKKIDGLLSYPEFSLLLLNFLNRPSLAYEICNGKKDSTFLEKEHDSKEEKAICKVYQQQIESLRLRWRLHLDKHGREY
jgi:hypothetical protein